MNPNQSVVNCIEVRLIRVAFKRLALLYSLNYLNYLKTI